MSEFPEVFYAYTGFNPSSAFTPGKVYEFRRQRVGMGTAAYLVEDDDGILRADHFPQETSLLLPGVEGQRFGWSLCDKETGRPLPAPRWMRKRPSLHETVAEKVEAEQLRAKRLDLAAQILPAVLLTDGKVSKDWERAARQAVSIANYLMEANESIDLFNFQKPR